MDTTTGTDDDHHIHSYVMHDPMEQTVNDNDNDNDNDEQHRNNNNTTTSATREDGNENDDNNNNNNNNNNNGGAASGHSTSIGDEDDVAMLCPLCRAYISLRMLHRQQQPATLEEV